MRGKHWALSIFMLLGLQSAQSGRAQVAVTRIDYKGWKDACMMRNRTATLIFVPQIGRIMHYGFNDGDNVLWENPELEGNLPDTLNLGKDWRNYGGDKLWPAPQARWGWPPSPTLDRAGFLNLSAGPEHGNNPARTPRQPHRSRMLPSLKWPKSS